MSTPEPFDRALRRLRRDRAATRFEAHGFLQRHIAQELVARLEIVQRDFSHALILGHAGRALGDTLSERGIEHVTAEPGARFAAMTGGVQCDEDRLPFEPESFDLVLSAGMLDTVNDLPGALLLINRVLRPDGLLLAGFTGAGSLPALRRATLEADIGSGGAQPRIHPQIDLRAAGDLLPRAGFALPVADGERLEVRYRSLGDLIADLRGAGMTSLLGGSPFSREAAARLHAAFEAQAVGGRIPEIFELIYLTAWSPSPDQPKPAQRGSGTASLADALRRKAGDDR